jgi:hypothetical protein
MEVRRGYRARSHLDACLEVFAEAKELVELILGYP